MSFDWVTFAFQTVNVAILLWLLSRVFWRPVTRLVAARKEAIAHDLAAAGAARSEADARLAEIEGRRRQIEAERDAILKAASRDAAAEGAALIAEARAQGDAQIAAARAQIAAERDTAQTAYGARAADLAVEMAARIGRGLDGPSLRAAALEALRARIAELPAAERDALHAAGALTITTAAVIDTKERHAIEAAIGPCRAPRFEVEPKLVAGLEIATPHMILAQSWRAEIERMRREIDDER